VSIWLQELERTYGIKALKKDIVRHEFSEVFTSLSRKQIMDLWEQTWDDYKRINLIDRDIPSILDNLRERFSISITTGNPNPNVRKWLSDNRIAYDRFMHFPEKSEKHRTEGIDIYIDDFHQVAKNVAGAGKTAILLRQPWNEGFIMTKAKTTDGIVVADNWRHIEWILLDMAKRPA
jgi:hypothetical protein